MPLRWYLRPRLVVLQPSASTDGKLVGVVTLAGVAQVQLGEGGAAATPAETATT